MRKADPLAGLRPPQPSPELRTRVLAAAARTGLQEPPGLIDRLWESGLCSRGWRIAAAVLFAANLVAAWHVGSRAGTVDSPTNGGAIAALPDARPTETSFLRRLLTPQQTATLKDIQSWRAAARLEGL
jgi:hypothetical protein